MGLTPHSKSITFSAAAIRAETSSTSRQVEVFPQDRANAILEKAGFSDGSFDLINPKNSLPFSPTDLPFNSLTDGATVTVQISRRGSPA